MSNPFLKIHQPAQQAVSREAKVRLRADADGNILTQPVNGRSTEVAEDGSLDRVEYDVVAFHGCGHSADLPIGGRCGVSSCGRVCCASCLGQCWQCGLPLCREHACFEDLDGQRVTFCSHCLAVHRRKRRVQRIRQAVTGFFVRDTTSGGTT